MTVLKGPVPWNANPEGCEWYLSSAYGGSRVVEVHIWGPTIEGRDSHYDLSWPIRHCLVCNVLDVQGLQTRFVSHDLAQGDAP